MREDYSRTAEGMALGRAIEQSLPAGRRIIQDPYAAAFLQNRSYRLIARSRPLSRLLLRFFARWAPGGQEFIAVRARLVDDLASEAAAAGATQIILLGAGFDTMAFRIREALRSSTLYEVDHPATQIIKRGVSARLDAPANVRFVGVDFERDDLLARLREAGHDGRARTFIVWVGVSYYLTAESARETMARAASLGGCGTRIVFDYMLREVIDRTTANRDALNKARRVAQLGEPWLFGLQKDEVPAFLEASGFRLLRDYDPEELGARYAPGRARPMSYVRIALAELAPRP
jgi:methyltransferase (TIGR00027 family)